MAETIKIDLRKAVNAEKVFASLMAEWWDVNSKFAVVRGTVRDDSEKFALRLDLDKRAFLDHLANPITDQIVHSYAHLLSQVIVSEKSKQRTTHVA